MSTFEALACIPKQQRTRRHEIASEFRSELKTPRDHQGDHLPPMAFLEGAVLWS
jgi:hypothetical protein